MRESGEGRGSVPSWSIAPGDRITAPDGDVGEVAAVGMYTGYVTVKWPNGHAVVYPGITYPLRRALPWE
jgi:hypothetical protein